EQAEATAGAAAPTATGSYGSSTDPAGGQCLWTTDPAGDPFSLTATNLELVVFQPDGPLPPPDYAPAPGSDEVVDEENQWYFADGSVVYLLRVTGEGRIDPAVLAAAEALIPALRERA
uniref:hypothetical protein n=1 Tax=Nocardioides stalactiti TaxID=2755356 RepID=UPI001600E376